MASQPTEIAGPLGPRLAPFELLIGHIILQVWSDCDAIVTVMITGVTGPGVPTQGLHHVACTVLIPYFFLITRLSTIRPTSMLRLGISQLETGCSLTARGGLTAALLTQVLGNSKQIRYALLW